MKILLRRPDLGFPLKLQGWQIPPNLKISSTLNVAILCSKIINPCVQYDLVKNGEVTTSLNLNDRVGSHVASSRSLKAVYFPFLNSNLNKFYRKLCFISFQKRSKN